MSPWPFKSKVTDKDGSWWSKPGTAASWASEALVSTLPTACQVATESLTNQSSMATKFLTSIGAGLAGLALQDVYYGKPWNTLLCAPSLLGAAVETTISHTARSLLLNDQTASPLSKIAFGTLGRYGVGKMVRSMG